MVFAIINEFLGNFFRSIRFQIDTPKPYGLLHISFVAGGTLLCAFLLYKLKKSKSADKVLCLCGVILLLLEVYKQLFYYYNSGEVYPWRIFPFQLCSIPMYLCIVLPLFRNSRIKDYIYDFLFIFSTLGGVMVLLVPSGVMSSYLTINIHSFLWHIILVFIGLFTVVTGKARVNIKAYGKAVTVFLICSVIAFIINVLLTDASKGEITMFFIGPNIPNVVVFKEIATNFGWYLATPLYLMCVCLGGYLVYIITFIIKHKTKK